MISPTGSGEASFPLKHLLEVGFRRHPILPYDEVNVIVGNGDEYIWHIVGCIQVRLHGGTERKNSWLCSIPTTVVHVST